MRIYFNLLWDDMAMTEYLLPAFAATPRTDLGALENKILCCDAMELLRQLPNNSIDMVLTSPPYDNLRTYNGFTWDFESIARETYRVLKQGGVCVWVVGDATVNGSETLTSMRQALYFVDVCGFKMHDTMIFQREGRFPESNRYWQEFEYMFVLSKDTPKTFNPVYVKSRNAGQSTYHNERQTDGILKLPKTERYINPMRAMSNIWYIGAGYMKSTQDIEAFIHPAMFPEKLAHDHIHTWSNPDDVILDFFMGSGTTAKIARNLGRKYIGCDLSAKYVALANRRLVNTDPFMDTVYPDGTRQLSLFAQLESVAS